MKLANWQVEELHDALYLVGIRQHTSAYVRIRKLADWHTMKLANWQVEHLHDALY
jgi:hypothetical protein